MKGRAFFFVLLIILAFGLINFSQSSEKLYRERVYEPVVLRGDILGPFYDIPINEIFMYAYQESTKTWNMLPFQIDEMAYGEDPFSPGAFQDFYFLDGNGVLDERDELVFMVRDLGDEAPPTGWIDNDPAKSFQRLEIEVFDQNVRQKRAFGYLFRSSTISDEIPSPYGFYFDPSNHITGSNFYSVRLSQSNGLIEDVIVKPPFGSGEDIFDTQKLRFIGVLNLGLITIAIGKNGSQAANERDNLYVYNENDVENYHLWYTPRPVVRLIREVRQTIRFGEFIMDEIAFYVKTKFYPFNGTIGGGADLDPETLKKEWNTEEDVYVQLDLLRQSWDFSEAATGMKFFNRNNQNIIIDGVPDQVNKTVKTPIREWMLNTGSQGSMFSFVEFDDTTWYNLDLYFYDNNTGGQADCTYIEGGDTGDSVSYGDQGILFQSHVDDSVSLKLNFNAYFLPGNLTQSEGEKLAYWMENPVAVQSRVESYTTQAIKKDIIEPPRNYRLYQNYPNPFNSSTVISFALPEDQRVTLNIYDNNGRIVAQLANDGFKAGSHQLRWDGRDDRDRIVASGVYFYEFRTKDFSSVKKLILLR